MFKINLHAHSRYSDGHNSIEEHALKCMELGHSACVITDHCFVRARLSKPKIGSTDIGKMKAARAEASEISARINYPIILGIELAIARLEEMLVFGSEAIDAILDIVDQHSDLVTDTFYAPVTIAEVKKVFTDHYAAAILCHPQLHNVKFPEAYVELMTILDGYEKHNSGQDFFSIREVPDILKGKKQFSNSDAHSVKMLEWCWNETDVEIKDEITLINYIKDPLKQPILRNIYKD